MNLPRSTWNRPLLLTLCIGLFITACWLWMFCRHSYGSSISLLEAWKYHGWLEGLELWFIGLYFGPWVVLACFILPWPMIHWQGRCPPGFWGLSLACLFVLMCCVDLWNDRYGLSLWGVLLGVLWGIGYLIMPVSAVWLGCHAIQEGYKLVRSLAGNRMEQTFRLGSMGWILFVTATVMVNIGCIVAGALASCWLKTNELGPFRNGLGSDYCCPFLPAPWLLHRMFTVYDGYAAIAWGILLSLVAAMLPLYTRQWKDAVRGFWIAFSASGYMALWAGGSVYLNYFVFGKYGEYARPTLMALFIFGLPVLVAGCVVYAIYDYRRKDSPRLQ